MAGVPILAYVMLGFPWEGVADGHMITVIFLSVALAIAAVGYGALLVTLDDLVSRRRSPELKRWLLRLLAIVIGCLLFAGELSETWRWIAD